MKHAYIKIEDSALIISNDEIPMLQRGNFSNTYFDRKWFWSAITPIFGIFNEIPLMKQLEDFNWYSPLMTHAWEHIEI